MAILSISTREAGDLDSIVPPEKKVSNCDHYLYSLSIPDILLHEAVGYKNQGI